MMKIALGFGVWLLIVIGIVAFMRGATRGDHEDEQVAEAGDAVRKSA